MMRNLLLSVGFFLAASLVVYSQSGTLKGRIIDKDSKEPIPFCNIIVEVTGAQKGGATSDFDGNYTIKPINPGTYDVKATYVGYKPKMVIGVIIRADKITFLDIEMEATTVTLETFEVIDYKVPLISKDQTSSGGTVTAEEISKMPNKSAAAVATTVGGVYSADGEVGSIRGQRSENTIYYIDGIRVTGSTALPESAIDQVSVVLGGIPAQYGDATGGIINVTTKGPSRKFGMGIEAQTSQYLDPYGYNRVGVNLNGPLIKSKDPSKNVSLLGYFIAGEFIYNQDGRPSATDLYKVKDDVLASLEETPLRPTGTGSGTYYNSYFLRMSDMEKINSSLNSSNYQINVSGKIDVRTSPTVDLSFGGNYSMYDSDNYNFFHSLTNYNNNSHSYGHTWRVFGKFTQRFPADNDSKSLINNVFYTIQADYTKTMDVDEDARHRDDLFSYGYIGKFTTYKTRNYTSTQEYDPVAGLYGYLMDNWQDTLYTYEPGTANPILANYTSQYYDMHPYIPNRNSVILSEGGILNGRGPEDIYSLWANPGALQSGYGKSDSEQIGIDLMASADIGNHAIQFGLQYQQRAYNGYNVDPTQFWSKMVQTTNWHIRELDLLNPQPVFIDGIFQDTINYYRKYDANSQFYFDKQLRQAMGLAMDGLDWIDVESYDVNTHTLYYFDKDGVQRQAVLEDGLNINMFSPDELLNEGDQIVGYYGYDAYGNKLKDKPTFEDFFTQKDENGNYTRAIAAYEPIYMAGYIQDVFAFRDLIFNVGLRVDRFDANQKVLKDKYVLYPAKTVKEVSDFGSHPSNMGPDYVVYVDNVTNPTKIMGYRDEGVWYNAKGVEVVDPEAELNAGNGVSPYLVDPNNRTIQAEAFEDYEPALNFMPRIAFSFPISDEALFYAHYDILTQRPTSNFFSSPTDYYFWEVRGNPTINNPDLRPEKTIDYELGFQQKLGPTSSLNLSAFYREVRDKIRATVLQEPIRQPIIRITTLTLEPSRV
ncbi:MAG: carboxypeptidase-like regulatory domain-containing protein [Bacteroidales bacterium]|nr:carboxypeptidase-like regulatory domain-containing protein [Bacteroidales bacterium]